MIVQIYEVQNASEAAALATCGVANIGVLVGDGAFPREIGPRATRTIFAACPVSVQRVALSLSADLSVIDRVIAETRPDILHLGAAPELLPPQGVAQLKARHPT